MLQRAYFTAQALGISTRTHQAIFDAGLENRRACDQRSGHPPPEESLPSIEDAANAMSA